MVWHELFPTLKLGCRKEGRDLRISAKKAVFLVSSGKKQISPLSDPLENFWKNPLVPHGKNPSNAHAHKQVKLHCKKLCCITSSDNTVQQHQCGKQAIAG